MTKENINSNTNNVKKLTKNALVKENKKLDKVDDFYVTINDESYQVTYDTFFRKTKQHELLDDLIKFFNAGENRIELFDLATPYTALLIIKHFTSLDVSDDIDEALELLQVLIDLNVLDVIINGLPEEEVVAVYELLSNMVSNLEKNLDEAERQAEELSEKVENDEIKTYLEVKTNNHTEVDEDGE